MDASDKPMSEWTPEEWGRAAVALPGWTWTMPWASLPDKHRRVWRRNWCTIDSGFGWTQVMGPRRRDGRPVFDAVDPDCPANEGCFLRLLGDHVHVHLRPGEAAIFPAMGGALYPGARSRFLGRACIAAAIAIGRWPGGAA